jgi:glycogen operon protein
MSQPSSELAENTVVRKRVTRQRSRPGSAYPLGATLSSGGVNFAVFSERATGIEICLFDRLDPGRESTRIALHDHTDGVWHGFVPGVKAGQPYGIRAHGAYAPEKGDRFNFANLLLDPYARAIDGDWKWGPETFGYRLGNAEDADLQRSELDSAANTPRSVVIDSSFDWAGDRPPRTPLDRSIVYEVHVKGFTKQCPNVPENLRGTYAGLASEFAIDYLKTLGVTAVELLPIHHFVNDDFLQQKGLSNYWGYNTMGYFAPHAAYSSNGDPGGQVAEFKEMVKALHAAGLEVILDVVYNHTAEGNHLGPTLCFRGLDNGAYYHLVADSPRYYQDYTGCGNSLNLDHPRTLQLVADSLRYWVLEMHVDGFRFDLATTLGRGALGFDRGAGFFDALLQDPVLSQVKLIAEPWDVGDYGYQVGGFPAGWSEWNGKYRDCVRAYWKGDEGMIGEFAARFAGSADLYHPSGRRPTASINFVAAHDGFTLNDLVSYNEKHNEANGEENRDGDNHNRSWNCGTEGPTTDPAINTLRLRQRRNFLATLFLSQGVPMLYGGDEFGRTQNGNNNTYCQDNVLNWFPWNSDAIDHLLLTFTKQLIAFRCDHPIFRRPKFFTGRKVRRDEFRDLLWINPGGTAMQAEEWSNGFSRCLGAILNGEAGDIHDAEGRPVHDDTFMILFNAHHEPVKFTLAGSASLIWKLLLDTRDETGFFSDPPTHAAGETIELLDRSLCLLRLNRVREPAKPRRRRSA